MINRNGDVIGLQYWVLLIPIVTIIFIIVSVCNYVLHYEDIYVKPPHLEYRFIAPRDGCKCVSVDYDDNYSCIMWACTRV